MRRDSRWRAPWRVVGIGLWLAVALVPPSSGSAVAASARPCAAQTLASSYEANVERALEDPRDTWGEALLRRPGGPSYAAARRYLKPLFLVGRPAGLGGQELTDSGVYYLAFGQPSSAGGGGPVALHVADGGEIVSGRANGAKLRVLVGTDGAEAYGSCLARLGTPSLGGGYLPILQTRYVDAGGARYRQESFATRIPETGALVSFVRLTIDAPGRVRVRFEPSEAGLSARGDRLVRGASTELFFSGDGRFNGSSLSYSFTGGTHTVYLARLERPAPTRPLTLDAAFYAQARRGLVSYWQDRLAAGASFSVPDPRVNDAERNLLIQNLMLGWRYSVGNVYELFEFPESLENAEVMGGFGFGQAQQAIVSASLRAGSQLYPDWEAGERLLAAAQYEQLYPDAGFLKASMPSVRRYVNMLAARLGAGRLLPKEQYASDLADTAYSLNGQAVDWQGLQAIANVLAAADETALAERARGAAERLGTRLRAALGASERRLPDGSLFVPVRLQDGEAPYDDLTASKQGSYWNLVIGDALASGLIPPGSERATAIVRYLLGHGSRLLGLLRFNYYPVRVGASRPGGLPGYRASGSDDVYNLSLERFLADNHQADQLVLSLYGQLAAGMTENTFVSGEGATIAPVPGEAFRSMYLPPNSSSNAAFLECLRLLLVHETITADGRPRGLELAYSTPRPWLEAGKRIVVSQAPTSFGPVSFTIAAVRGAVHVSLEPPHRAPVHSLKLRLRLPAGEQIASVSLDGRLYSRFDRASQTIDLTGRSGPLELTVGVR